MDADGTQATVALLVGASPPFWTSQKRGIHVATVRDDRDLFQTEDRDNGTELVTITITADFVTKTTPLRGTGEG